MKKNSEEFRLMQRNRILKVQPWLKSTGAKTHQGKEKSKMNALKTSFELHKLIKKYERLMRQQKEIQQIVRF